MYAIGNAVKLDISNQVILPRQTGRTPHEKAMHMVRLFGEEIILHFK